MIWSSQLAVKTSICWCLQWTALSPDPPHQFQANAPHLDISIWMANKSQGLELWAPEPIAKPVLPHLCPSQTNIALFLEMLWTKAWLSLLIPLFLISLTYYLCIFALSHHWGSSRSRLLLFTFTTYHSVSYVDTETISLMASLPPLFTLYSIPQGDRRNDCFKV